MAVVKAGERSKHSDWRVPQPYPRATSYQAVGKQTSKSDFSVQIKIGSLKNRLTWDYKKSSQNMDPLFAQKSQILRFIYKGLDIQRWAHRPN